MSVTKLAISPELQLPVDAVTETFGILAVKRAGKSNAAVVMAEEMFDAGLPWVAIDPKGDWWGIRSSADGNGPGLPILVLGGLHGDVPLEAASGHLVADLVVDQRLTCVIDVSEMSKADQRRFLADFAERLYKRNREPLHVFCEEADEYIPQMVRGDVARLVGAFETLVKRGGFRGLGITLITQRSASLNKDALTQVQTLFAMRTTSPQDRKAILGWVVQHAVGQEMVNELPALASGEAWMFSPNWLHKLEKITFRRRRTFDSGATPKVGIKVRPPVKLADVDIAKLRERMATTIEKAKADDPRELRKRIQELEKKLLMADINRTTEIVRHIEVPVLDQEAVRKLQAAFERHLQQGANLIVSTLDDVVVEALKGHKLQGQVAKPAVGAGADVASPRARTATYSRLAPPAERNGHSDKGTDFIGGKVTGPQQRIVNALAWLESVRIPQARKVQVALLAGASPKSSAYTNNLGSLRSAGLVEYPGPGVVALTDLGRLEASSNLDIPSTSEELHRQLYTRLSGPQQRILQVLIDAYPKAVAKYEVADRSGASAQSSAFTNNLGSLRSLGLIDYPGPGMAIAAEVLFLEAGAA